MPRLDTKANPVDSEALEHGSLFEAKRYQDWLPPSTRGGQKNELIAQTAQETAKLGDSQRGGGAAAEENGLRALGCRHDCH